MARLPGSRRGGRSPRLAVGDAVPMCHVACACVACAWTIVWCVPCVACVHFRTAHLHSFRRARTLGTACVRSTLHLCSSWCSRVRCVRAWALACGQRGAMLLQRPANGPGTQQSGASSELCGAVRCEELTRLRGLPTANGCSSARRGARRVAGRCVVFLINAYSIPYCHSPTVSGPGNAQRGSGPIGHS